MEDNNMADINKASESQAGSENTRDPQSQAGSENIQNSGTQTESGYTQGSEPQTGSDYSQTAGYQQTAAYDQTGYQVNTDNAQAGSYQAVGYIYDQYGNPVAYDYGYGYVNQERNLYGEEKKDIIMAVLSLVFGITGILTSAVLIGLSFDIAAIVLGIVVLKRRYYGKKLAIAGLITSGIGILLSIGVVVFLSIAARDLTGELIGTLVDYFYYYSDGGLDESYGLEDEYSDEYVEEYPEEDYIDDTVTDEGYLDEGTEEIIEEEPAPEIVDEVSANSSEESVPLEDVYAGTDEISIEEISENEVEEDYLSEGDETPISPAEFMENIANNNNM